MATTTIISTVSTADKKPEMNQETMERSQITSQKTSTAHEARLLCRHNLVNGTAGIAPGYLQANLIVLPSKHADHFRALCTRNPVACPLLGVTTTPGDPHHISPAACIKTPDDFDIRTDFPKYRVYKHGNHIATTTDLKSVWTSDHVAFLIGCSYSFEDALTAADLPPRHHITNRVVAMYRSNIPVLPSGIFTGARCIVSMRPYRLEDLERVRDVTRAFLSTHGEPVAWGWDGAKEIGIEDISRPDFGEPQDFKDGEVPVFWVSIY